MDKLGQSKSIQSWTPRSIPCTMALAVQISWFWKTIPESEVLDQNRIMKSHKRCSLATFSRMLFLCQQAGLSSFLHLQISSLFSEVTAVTTWAWCWTLIPGIFLTNTVCELLAQALLYTFYIKKFHQVLDLWCLCDYWSWGVHFFITWRESHHKVTVRSLLLPRSHTSRKHWQHWQHKMFAVAAMRDTRDKPH